MAFSLPYAIFHLMKYFLTILLLFLHCAIQAEPPVAYQGRFRPFEAYARLQLDELYHNPKLTPDFLWQLHFFGHQAWDDTPLFYVSKAELKKSLGLDPSQTLFSYIQMTEALRKHPPGDSKEISRLSDALAQVSQMEGQHSINNDTPLRQRLLQAGNTFKMLPSRYSNGEWYSLKALKLTASNFTVYSDKQFEAIRTAYLKLEQGVAAHKAQKEIDQLFAAFSAAMEDSYRFIAGKTYQEAYGKSLQYPSSLRLKAEAFYTHTPLLETAFIFYALGLICFALSKNLGGVVFLTLAFLVHTLILALRCYILQRPPVSNMFETVIYVPWMAMLAGFALYLIFKNRSALISSALVSTILIAVLKAIGLNYTLENVQAVLDSQYWLIIHVLMVVGSYGLFCLAGLLGHYYAIGYLVKGRETDQLKTTALILRQSLYLGLALLISGTLLGGVWAAQSWGRFWDWDPKESWAFISCCVYLIVIHAYTFHHVGNFGLAIGSIIGLQMISFTWYGVNYILGTGLHSYGFGSGGEIYYYIFLSAESAFILWALFANYKRLQTR